MLSVTTTIEDSKVNELVIQKKPLPVLQATEPMATDPSSIMPTKDTLDEKQEGKDAGTKAITKDIEGTAAVSEHKIASTFPTPIPTSNSTPNKSITAKDMPDLLPISVLLSPTILCS